MARKPTKVTAASKQEALERPGVITDSGTPVNPDAIDRAAEAIKNDAEPVTGTITPAAIAPTSESREAAIVLGREKAAAEAGKDSKPSADAKKLAEHFGASIVAQEGDVVTIEKGGNVVSVNLKNQDTHEKAVQAAMGAGFR